MGLLSCANYYSGYNGSREEDFSLARYGFGTISDEEDESFKIVLATPTPSEEEYILQSTKQTSDRTAAKLLIGRKVAPLAATSFDLHSQILVIKFDVKFPVAVKVILNIKRYNLQWGKFKYQYTVFCRETEKAKMRSEFFVARAKLKRLHGSIAIRRSRTYSRNIYSESECIKRVARCCHRHSLCIYKESECKDIVLPQFMPAPHRLDNNAVISDCSSKRTSLCSDDDALNSENEFDLSPYNSEQSGIEEGPF